MVDGDRSLLDLHRTIIDELRADLLDALRRVDGENPGDRRAVLTDAHGVTALNGHLAAIAADAADDLRQVDLGRVDREDCDDLAHFFDVLSQLGDGTADGLPSDLDDLDDALPALLAGVATTPRVTVKLGVSWAGRRREQRAAVLNWLSRLGLGAAVDLVPTEAAARVMVKDHRADLPAGPLTSLRNRGRDAPGPLAAEADDVADSRAERAADAVAALSADGRPAGLLRTLADSHTHALTFDAAARRMALDASDLHDPAASLRSHGLAESVERADGATVVSLSPAGLDASRRLSRSSSRSAAGPADAHTGSGSEAASRTPQNAPAMPCCPSQGREDPSPAGPAADRDDDRAAEAAETDRTDRTDRWEEGAVTPRYLPRRRWLPAAEAADMGEVALVDADLGLDPDRDGREPGVSYDADRDAVVLSGEYHNPLQFAVTLAHGVLSEKMLAAENWADRIGDRLDGLDVSDRPVLWNAVCMGWLPADATTGADVLDELRGGRDDLLALLKDLDLRGDGDDVADNRSRATSHALGLLTTAVDLLDLLGVDVTLECRVPNAARHFGADGNPRRRGDLLDHLAKLSALNSRAGVWSVWRQLFENRETVRSDGWTPGIADAKTGSLNCSLVVVGDGAESLADDLRDRLDAPAPVHEDAPPIGVDVDLRVGTDRARLGSTVRRMLRARGLRPTRTGVMVMVGFTASPWAAADGLHWGLAGEAGRDLHLDEIRRALSTLDADRLLPDAAPSARQGVATLLRADEPLSQAALADRAGISRQSWRNHRDALVALDVVRETAEGWRVALPRRDERYGEISLASPPWWLQADGAVDVPGDVGADGRRPADVLDWLLWDRLDLDRDELDGPTAAVVDSLAGIDPPDRSLIDDALNSLGAPPALIRAGCNGSRERELSSAAMGRVTQQTTISSHTPQNAPNP